MIKYDVVYFFAGDEWHEATEFKTSTKQTKTAYEARGFVAVEGLRKIGPPDTPPSPERLAEVEKLLGKQ